MADLTLDTAATLFRSEALTIAASGLQNATIVKEGPLGELIGDVVHADASEHWRYIITTDDAVLLKSEHIREWAGRFGIGSG